VPISPRGDTPRDGRCEPQRVNGPRDRAEGKDRSRSEKTVKIKAAAGARPIEAGRDAPSLYACHRRHDPRGRPSRAPGAKAATAAAERRTPRREARPARTDRRPRRPSGVASQGVWASDGGIRRVKGSRRASLAVFPKMRPTVVVLRLSFLPSSGRTGSLNPMKTLLHASLNGRVPVPPREATSYPGLRRCRGWATATLLSSTTAAARPNSHRPSATRLVLRSPRNRCRLIPSANLKGSHDYNR
jgi:hypothetical protein